MDKEQVQQLIDLFQEGVHKMSDTLGVAVPNLWRILIKQQYVEAVQGFVFVIIILALWKFVFFRFHKFVAQESKGDYDSIWEFLFPMMTIVLVIATLISFFVLCHSIGVLINPEYYALQTIFEFIKK